MPPRPHRRRHEHNSENGGSTSHRADRCSGAPSECPFSTITPTRRDLGGDCNTTKFFEEGGIATMSTRSQLRPMPRRTRRTTVPAGGTPPCARTRETSSPPRNRLADRRCQSRRAWRCTGRERGTSPRRLPRRPSTSRGATDGPPTAQCRDRANPKCRLQTHARSTDGLQLQAREHRVHCDGGGSSELGCWNEAQHVSNNR